MSTPAGEPGPEGRLRPTGPATVGVTVMVGLVAGWLLHPVSARLGHPPVVSWVQPVSLAFVAVLLLAAAYGTHRTLHVRRDGMAPHQAVNRLLLARSCVVVGGLVAGGYFGYAVSWLGLRAELAGERILRSSLAGMAGVAIVIGALLLERACRVRSGEDQP